MPTNNNMLVQFVTYCTNIL